MSMYIYLYIIFQTFGDFSLKVNEGLVVSQNIFDSRNCNYNSINHDFKMRIPGKYFVHPGHICLGA